MAVKFLCTSYRNSCDATSVMSFFSPTMDNVGRDETCARRYRSASACRSLPAVMDRFDVSLFAHVTVGVLSQDILM